MKKLISIIIINTFLFSGTVYMSIDVQNGYGAQSDFLYGNFDNTFNNGAIMLGYSQTVYKQDKFILDIGFSFSMKPSELNYEAIFEDISDPDRQADYYNFYLMPNFQISDRVNLWAQLGEVLGRTNITDERLKPGLSYGIGLNFLALKQIGIGLGYRVYNSTVDMSLYEGGIYDFTSSNSSTWHIKVKRMSIDLFYRFN